MYITKQDLDTLYEAEAFIEGQIECADDSEYWSDFLHRFQIVRKKADKQFATQNFNKEVKSRGRALANER